MKNKLLVIVQNFREQPLKNLLITLIVLITVVKLNLMGTGFMSMIDETRYNSSGLALQKLSEFKPGAAIGTLFSTQGRPADAIIKTIPATFQFLTARLFKQNFFESNNSYPLFIFNFIIYCFILIVHFKFSKLVFKESFLAMISVLLFSSLTNSYLYLRHALPYDTSLLIFYLVIYKIAIFTEENSLTYKKSFLAGVISFLAYLVYPGYFPLFIFALLLLFFNQLTKTNFLKRVYHSCCYILGSLSCLSVFEAISRLAGCSYISDALRLSTTIIQGSFEESFSFIVKYLFEVEGVTGIILIIGYTLFCLVMIHQIINKSYKQNSLILLSGVAFTGLFIAYASAGYFFHKMVFYGRLLHQYFPFVCIFSLFAINELIKTLKRNKLALFILSIVFIINFGTHIIPFNSLTYPRDIGWKLSKTMNLQDIEYVCEYDNSWSVIPLNENVIHPVYKTRTDSIPDRILVNGCYFYQVDNLAEYHEFIPGNLYHLVESKSHFQNFKAYQYEGFSIKYRQNLDKLNFHIKLFSSGNLPLK